MELILHLSDIHMPTSFSNVDDEVRLIVNSIYSKLSSEIIEGLVIAITGDLTKSGQEAEFCMCAEFIKKIKLSLSKKFNIDSGKVLVVSCPGNHDLNFDSPLKRKDYMQMSMNDRIKYYTKALNNYYKSYFNLNNAQGWFVTKKYIKYKDICINFTSLNTTIGSILEDGEIDKAIHSLPNNCFDSLDTDDKHINFLLMHHSVEWFQDNEWGRLLDYQKKYYNVVLFGHEHKNRDNHIENNGKIIEEICGGSLLSQNSIFNFMTIDSSKKITFYKASKANDCYDVEQTGPEYRIKQNDNFLQMYNNDFYKEINEYSLVEEASLQEIFVFPTMNYVDGEGKDAKINNFDEFIRIIKKTNSKIIYIDGDDLSGKSELSKSLFLSSMSDFHPLLLNYLDFQVGNIDSCFKRVISKEYKSSIISCSKYYQYEEGKIAIFDDFDNLDYEKSQKIKKYLIEKFDIIIIFKNPNNVNLLKNIRDVASESDKCLTMTLSPMLYRKREQLIYNICSIYHKNKSQLEIKKISKIINESISKQLNILNLNPQFVVLCVNSFLKNDIQFGSSNGFTSVFQSNIVRQLEKINELNKDDIEEYLFLLQKISYKSHVSQEYPISYETISGVITAYNLDGEGVRPNVSINDFINNLKKCKMIQCSSSDVNKYVFLYSNYYSYFVAKNIVSLISDASMDKSVIDKLIKEMCFGVNGDILLYMSYILQSSSVIDAIFNVSKEFFDNFGEEINLNPKNCNVQYLLLKSSKLMLDIPNKKDMENNLKKRENDENRIIKKKKEAIDYNYTEKDLNNTFIKIKQAIKYIELLSRLLPDFMHLNPKASKEIVRGLYSYANKLLYYVLKPYEELFEKDSQILKELYEDGDIFEDYIDESKLKQAIQHASNNFILNVYNLIARLSATKKTIYAFDCQCDKNLASNQILNLMIHENVEKLEDFSKNIVMINKKYNDVLIENYLKKIIRHHCLKNPVSYYGTNQSIINKYLVKSPSKNKVVQLRMKKK